MAAPVAQADVAAPDTPAFEFDWPALTPSAGLLRLVRGAKGKTGNAVLTERPLHHDHVKQREVEYGEAVDDHVCRCVMSDVLSLPARLDPVAVRALAPQFSDASKSGTITLDAGAVTHMGALAAQLILSAARDVRAAGGALTFTDISTRATDQLALMGLSPTQLSEGA